MGSEKTSPDDLILAKRVDSSPNSREESTRLIRILGLGELLSVTGARDQRIAAIADLQRGRVSRRQLLAAGVSSGQITTLLSKRFLCRLHSGVYAVGHSAPVELGRETAALLACPDRAVLSHLSAAGVWAILPLDANLPVDVTVLGGSASPQAGINLHRTRSLAAADRRVHQRLPITSPARTLIDIAGLLDGRSLERALDEARVRRLVQFAQVQEALDRMPMRPGARALATLLDHRRPTTLTRSQLEEKFLVLIRAAGLPAPDVNVRLHGFLVDFYWRAERVAVEIDSYWYHSTRSSFTRDHRKDAVLAAAHIDVRRFSEDQLDDEPFAVVAQVVQALEAARTRHAT